MLRLALSHEYRHPTRHEFAGGDVVAFVRHEDNGATFMLADLSAKGAEGVRLAECLANAFHLACATVTLPSHILRRMNNLLVHLFCDVERGLFATAFVCRFSVLESHCIYSSAGAEPPILWKDNRFYQTLPTEAGILLGIEPNAVYRDFVVPLAANDTVVAFTDGISESKRVDGEGRLGVHGVVEAMNATLDREARLECCDVLAEIDRLNGSAYHDDATLLVASIRSRSSHRAEVRELPVTLYADATLLS